MEISIQDAEGCLARLLESAAMGQDIVITRDGLAVGRIVPIAPPTRQSDEEIVASLSPPARRLWQNRARLDGITTAELLSEGRKDQR